MKYRVQNIVNNEYLDDDGIFLLPNGEVGYFITDGSYPHYRKFGHQENFRVINEDCERLQKKLDIAVKCLDTYANEDYWLYCCKACGGSYYTLHKDKINLKYGEYPARDVLAKIKDLNK